MRLAADEHRSDDFSVGAEVWQVHRGRRDELRVTILPEKGAVVAGRPYNSDHLPAVVNRQRDGLVAGERAEVAHLTILPNEGTPQSINAAHADDEAVCIDACRPAGAAIVVRGGRAGERGQGAKVPHDPIFPNEWMEQLTPVAVPLRDRRDFASTNDLTTRIPRQRGR